MPVYGAQKLVKAISPATVTGTFTPGDCDTGHCVTLAVTQFPLLARLKPAGAGM